MSLWDALTGKIYHYNTTKQQANDYVCKHLRWFVDSRLRDCPGSESSVIYMRDSMFAYYCGAQSFFSAAVNGGLACYKDAIFSLNMHGYLNLISALHTGQIVTMFLSSERESPQEQSWFFLQTAGICEMYGRPQSYIDEWIDRFKFITESEENIPHRLVRPIYNDVANVLGLRVNDFTEAMVWGGIQLECVRSARQLFDDPRWHDHVENKLAAH